MAFPWTSEMNPVTPQLRRVFADSFSIYSVIKDIKGYFHDAGLHPSELPQDHGIQGERRQEAYRFYESVDWANQAEVNQVLGAWSAYLQHLEDRRDTQELDKLTRHLNRHGFGFANGRIRPGAALPDAEFYTQDTKIWEPGFLRLFLSHVSSFKKTTAALRTALLDYGITSFVAHDDIAPSLPWQSVIEVALSEMEALAALLTDGFHESAWTDQEIGYALGRGIPVISLRRDLDPYGFIAKEQAINARQRSVAQVAHDIALTLRRHRETREGMGRALAARLARSSSWTRSERTVGLLEEVAPLSEIAKDIAERGFFANPEVRNATDVPARLGRLIGKMLPAEGA